MAEKLASAQELRGWPESDLHAQLEKCRQELWQLRLKAKDGALQQGHRLLMVRRQVARLLTVLRQHQMSPQPQGQ